MYKATNGIEYTVKDQVVMEHDKENKKLCLHLDSTADNDIIEPYEGSVCICREKTTNRITKIILTY